MQRRALAWAVVASASMAVSGLGLATAAAFQSTQQPGDPRTIVDRVYSVAQADRGEQRFKTSCSSCHTPASFADGAFADQWSGQTMAEVFDYVSTQMPENDPGGLRPQEYADVLAYILSVNAYPAGIEELPVDKAALKLLGIAPNPK